MRLFLYALCAAALALPGGGCEWMKRQGLGGRPEPIAPRGRGDLPPVTSQQLVGYLNQRAAPLNAVTYNDVRVRVKEDRSLPINLSGNLACAQPRSVRMVCEHAVAGKQLDLGSNEREFWIYAKPLPENSNFLYCSHTDFEAGKVNLPFPFEPDWVMQAVGMVRFPEDNKYDVKVDQERRVYVLSWEARTPQGQPLRKEVEFRGDPAVGTQPQVTRHAVRDANGQVVAAADVKRAQTLTLGVDPQGRPAAAQIPTNVVLTWPAMKFEMDLTLDEPRVNPNQDSARLFTRPTIRGTNPVDLARYEFRPTGR